MKNSTTCHFDMVSGDGASPKAKALIQKAQTNLDMVPNMYAYMVNFPPLLDAYMYGY